MATDAAPREEFRVAAGRCLDYLAAAFDTEPWLAQAMHRPPASAEGDGL